MALYTVKDGEVVLIEDAVQEIIKQRSVYALSPLQEDIGKGIIGLLKTFNTINSQSNGMLLERWDDLFYRKVRKNGQSDPLAFDADKLKELLQYV